MDYQRKELFDGEHIYSLTRFYVEGTAGSLWTQTWGLNVDRERYAQLGYPEVKADMDFIYQVLVDILGGRSLFLGHPWLTRNRAPPSQRPDRSCDPLRHHAGMTGWMI